MKMTLSQVKGMLHFHKRAYLAYRQAGNKQNAHMARVKMLQTYLQYRAIRNTR